MPSSSPEYSPFALLPRPGGRARIHPRRPFPLYLTGCGDRPGQLIGADGPVTIASRRAFRPEVTEPGPDVVGERVREAIEDGDGLPPGRPGGPAVALGQQRVAKAGQRVALAERGGDVAVGLDGPGVLGLRLGGVAQLEVDEAEAVQGVGRAAAVPGFAVQAQRPLAVG